MSAAGEGKALSGPRLAAELAALAGVAPAPACHVVFRATRFADGQETRGYEVPDEAGPLAEAAWPRWLRERGLLGRDQLRVAALVIREVLDQDGRLAEAVLERRRGGAGGPLHGNPARVQFVGPARLVRAYRTDRDGQLLEVAPSPRTQEPETSGAELFLGERQALERRFGLDIEVVDTREPTPFEDMAGLASIVHLRRGDGPEIACGIGWHGPMAFILEADFPRFDIPLALPPGDEAAVHDAARQHGLVRHEIRVDERGLAVVARRHGSEALFLLRPVAGRVGVEPYQLATVAPAGDDQRRWLRYIETHERLVPLDHYRDGQSENLVVLTGDASGHVWRHHVDADGVETTRRLADDTAVASLHREHQAPGTLARLDGGPLDGASEPQPAPETIAPPDSPLAIGRAFVAAMAALQASTNAVLAKTAEAGLPPEIFDFLDALRAPLEALSAEYAASQLEALQRQAVGGTLDAGQLVSELVQLEAGLQKELALIRQVPLLPAQSRRLNNPAPFGTAVEERFSACAYDIEEAASCLAFRRPTAAVFHCMKILERGLFAFERCVGISPPPGVQRGWSDIMAGLRTACPPPLAPALVRLQWVQRRWRAPSLIPAAKYTETEAELIFQSVGAFMRELADRCDEHGEASTAPHSGKERHAG